MKSEHTNVSYEGEVQKFLFRWVRNIFCIRIKAVDTRAEVNKTMLEIESQTQYFKFIKKKIKSFKLPLGNIKAIKSKRLFKYCVVTLTTNLNNEIKIPTSNKELALEFVSILKENTDIV